MRVHLGLADPIPRFQSRPTTGGKTVSPGMISPLSKTENDDIHHEIPGIMSQGNATNTVKLSDLLDKQPTPEPASDKDSYDDDGSGLEKVDVSTLPSTKRTHPFTSGANTPVSAIYITASNPAVSTTSASSAGVVASKQSRKRRRQNCDGQEAIEAEQPATKKPVYHTFSGLRSRITPRVPSEVIKKPPVPAFLDLFGGITPRAPPKIIKKMMPITKEEADRLQRSRNVTARFRVSKAPSRPARTPSQQAPARPVSARPISAHPPLKYSTSARPTPSSLTKKLNLKHTAPRDDEEEDLKIVYNPRPRSKAALKVKAILEDSDDDLITSTKPTTSKFNKGISINSVKSKVYSTATTTTGDEEDADYKYALGLHAELNGIRSRHKRR